MRKLFTSSVGHKFIMSVTGIALVGFLVSHLAANSLLLLPDGELFNQYAHTLASWGYLLYVAEAGLASLFLIHIVTAIRVTMNNKGARPEGYSQLRTKGGPSKSGFASKFMIVTGLILGVFLVLHIMHFKFGEMDTAYINGEAVKDLHGLVIREFHETYEVLFYVGVMLLLFFHLRHGFWSLFQSLGLAQSERSAMLYRVGFLVAAVIGFGFMIIPIWIYFDGPEWLAQWM